MRRAGLARDFSRALARNLCRLGLHRWAVERYPVGFDDEQGLFGWEKTECSRCETERGIASFTFYDSSESSGQSGDTNNV